MKITADIRKYAVEQGVSEKAIKRGVDVMSKEFTSVDNV